MGDCEEVWGVLKSQVPKSEDKKHFPEIWRFWGVFAKSWDLAKHPKIACFEICQWPFLKRFRDGASIE